MTGKLALQATGLGKSYKIGKVKQAVLKGVCQPYFAYAQTFRGSFHHFCSRLAPLTSKQQWMATTFDGNDQI